MIKLWRAVIDALDDPALFVAASDWPCGSWAWSVTRSTAATTCTAGSVVSCVSCSVRIPSEVVQFGVKRAATAPYRRGVSPGPRRDPAPPGVAGMALTGAGRHHRRNQTAGRRPAGNRLPRPLNTVPSSGSPSNASDVATVVVARPDGATDCARPTKRCTSTNWAAVNLNPLEDHEESMSDAVLPGALVNAARWSTGLLAHCGGTQRERTPQRRLNEEGTLVLGARRVRAATCREELLADLQAAVSEVAFMLGYSNQRFPARLPSLVGRRRVAAWREITRFWHPVVPAAEIESHSGRFVTRKPMNCVLLVNDNDDIRNCTARRCWSIWAGTCTSPTRKSWSSNRASRIGSTCWSRTSRWRTASASRRSPRLAACSRRCSSLPLHAAARSKEIWPRVAEVCGATVKAAGPVSVSKLEVVDVGLEKGLINLELTGNTGVYQKHQLVRSCIGQHWGAGPVLKFLPSTIRTGG